MKSLHIGISVCLYHTTADSVKKEKLVFHVFQLAQFNWSKKNMQLCSDITGLSPAEDMCILLDCSSTKSLDFLIPQYVSILREMSLTVQFQDGKIECCDWKGPSHPFLTSLLTLTAPCVPWAVVSICIAALRTIWELVSVQKTNKQTNITMKMGRLNIYDGIKQGHHGSGNEKLYMRWGKGRIIPSSHTLSGMTWNRLSIA